MRHFAVYGHRNAAVLTCDGLFAPQHTDKKGADTVKDISPDHRKRLPNE
ncbi:MAG: hypothetical protein ACR2G0_01745 [Chthoniobacterales bacterium]